MNSWPICIVLASQHDVPVSIPGSGSINSSTILQSIYNVCLVTFYILWQINCVRISGSAFVKNVGTANTHNKKKSKEKRNEIQSPEKDLLLMTSWDPFSVPSTSKVHPMGRDRDRYEISAKRTLAIRKRRPRNVNLGICYVPSTSQTSQSDVFCASMGLQCAIWEVSPRNNVN
jgi:hypothetical protein